METATATPNAEPLNVCQHCGHTVTWGTPADWGYKRFMHDANGSDECPTDA